MNLNKILFIFLALFFILHGNVTLADSCRCTARDTAVAESCEQKGETECYSQLNTKKSCSFYTDDSCKNLKDMVVTGFAWTADECKTAKGDWRPPEGGANIGPYCYEKQDFTEPYNLQVDILGVNKAGGISNLGQYINVVYKFIVGLAIFFGIIMTTIAGFKWLTAGGNAGKIGEAKKMIVNAIIGLMIATGAYTILQTINPRLLELHLPLIPKIKTTSFVGIRGCEWYKTLGDCEGNVGGLNTGIAPYAPAGYSGTGCAWDAQTRQCLQGNKAEPGKKGGLCLVGDKCEGELQCVFTANIHVCTDGNINSVCGTGANNDGCKEGLICNPWNTKNYSSVCYKKGVNQPQGTPCSEDKQCGSKICAPDGHCTAYTLCDDTHPCEAGKECLLAGTGNNKYRECRRPTVCYANSGCTTTYGADAFCPADLLKQADNDYQKNYINGSYAISGTKDSPFSVCKYKLATGAVCGFDDECKTGSCINKKLMGNKEQGACR